MTDSLLDCLYKMVNAPRVAFDVAPWEESEHPRAKNGEFTHKGAGESAIGQSSSQSSKGNQISSASGNNPRPAFIRATHESTGASVNIPTEHIDMLEDLMFNKMSWRRDFGEGAMYNAAIQMLRAGEVDDFVIEQLQECVAPNSVIGKALASITPKKKRSEIDMSRPPVAEKEIDRISAAAKELGFASTGDEPDYSQPTAGNGYNCFLADICLFLQHMIHLKITPRELDAGYTEANRILFTRIKNAMKQSGWVPINESGDPQVTQKIISEMPDGTWISYWSGDHNTSTIKYKGKWYKRDAFFDDSGKGDWEEVSEKSLAEHAASARIQSKTIKAWDAPCFAFVPGKSLIPDIFLKMMTNHEDYT